jgi:hypothetical protein
MKRVNKSRVILKLGLLLILFGVSTLPSCHDDFLGSMLCSCDSDHPYSYGGAKYCYATLSQCENDTGKHCIDCSK